MNKPTDNVKETIEQAVLGGGCFWCLEALFSKIAGVVKVIPGYAGGDKENPTYEQVCTGTTGHAEVVEIHYNSRTINYQDILNYFWKFHEPTTENRQGSDVGSQYRSIILFKGDKQQKAALESKKKAQAYFNDPIVTEIAALNLFYPAEEYHYNYFNKNPAQAYCRIIIQPKLLKHFP